MLQQHEEILSHVKIQLKNQVRFKSLKVLCARKVVDYLPLYASKGLRRLSPILPKPLFSLVYKEFLKTFEDITNTSGLQISREDWQYLVYTDLVEKVFFFAEDGEIEEFDCIILNAPGGKLENRRPQFRSSFFQRLAVGSPKLKFLRDNQDAKLSFLHYDNRLLSDHYSLQLMSSLVVFENDFYPAKDADLQVIGLHLPLLQRLLLLVLNGSNEEPFDKISSEGLEYLTKLKMLKELTFIVEVYQHRILERYELMKNCFLLMPQVNTKIDSTRSAPHEFPSYEGPVELGLEHLVLGESSVIPSNVMLPNVTKITVKKSIPFSLERFKKLLWLSVRIDDWTQLDQTLSEVGHLLNTLMLSTSSSLDIMKIFRQCPNLEELYLYDVQFVGNFYPHPQLKNSIRKLKSFTVDKFEVAEEDLFDSRGLLHLLFTSCPELIQLKMAGVSLQKPEMDLLNKDLNSGRLAVNKLQEVEIKASVAEAAVPPFAEFVVKLCIENCHTLKKVKIDDYFLDYPDVPEMDLAKKVQYFINKHKYLCHLKNNPKF